MENKYLGLPTCLREYAKGVDDFCNYLVNQFYGVIENSGFKRSDLYDDNGKLNKIGTYLVIFYLIQVSGVVCKQYEYKLVEEYLKKYDF